MAVNLNLILRSSASPHLYLDTIKEMIKDDNELLPQTKKALLLMKRLKKSFVQIPLQMQVVICPAIKVNLERALSPALGNFNYTDWSDDNIESYKNDSKAFLEKIKKLYNKMGYEVEETIFDDKKAEEIYKQVKESEKNMLEKLKIKKDKEEKKKEAEQEIKKAEKEINKSGISKDYSLTPAINMPKLDLPNIDLPKLNTNVSKKEKKK